MKKQNSVHSPDFRLDDYMKDYPGGNARLAKRSNVSTTTISKARSGNPILWKTGRALARGLGIEMEEVFEKYNYNDIR